MLSIEDTSMLKDFEKAELENPSPRKVVDEDRTIYLSRRLRKPRNNYYGLPILCDFGEARIGPTQESGPFVQPHIYRAPEIIFEMQWGSAVDIWNVACLVRYRFSVPALMPSTDCHRFGIFLKASIYSATFLTRAENTMPSSI